MKLKGSSVIEMNYMEYERYEMCPFCHSNYMRTDTQIQSDGYIVMSCSCPDCGNEWDLECPITTIVMYHPDDKMDYTRYNVRHYGGLLPEAEWDSGHDDFIHDYEFEDMEDWDDTESEAYQAALVRDDGEFMYPLADAEDFMNDTVDSFWNDQREENGGE